MARNENNPQGPVLDRRTLLGAAPWALLIGVGVVGGYIRYGDRKLPSPEQTFNPEGYFIATNRVPGLGGTAVFSDAPFIMSVKPTELQVKSIYRYITPKDINRTTLPIPDGTIALFERPSFDSQQVIVPLEKTDLEKPYLKAILVFGDPNGAVAELRRGDPGSEITPTYNFGITHNGTDLTGGYWYLLTEIQGQQKNPVNKDGIALYTPAVFLEPNDPNGLMQPKRR